MKLRKAEPVRYERTSAFVMRARGCSMEEIQLPVYEPSAMAADLRERRRKAGVSLRDAASSAGVRAVEWSGVEQGRLCPESVEDWQVLRLAAKGGA